MHAERIKALKGVHDELRALEDINHEERKVAQNCAMMVEVLEEADKKRVRLGLQAESETPAPAPENVVKIDV